MGGPGDECGHAHVAAKAQRDDGAKHGEPQEQGGGEFVGPDQWGMEGVTGDDTDEQDNDFRDHQKSRDGFEGFAEDEIDLGWEREG